MTTLLIILGILLYCIIGRVFSVVILEKGIIEDPMDVVDFMGWLVWPIIICYLVIRIVSDFFINLFL